jgi:uncharacterized protein YecT (DUF1311 family)
MISRTEGRIVCVQFLLESRHAKGPVDAHQREGIGDGVKSMQLLENGLRSLLSQVCGRLLREVGAPGIHPTNSCLFLMMLMSAPSIAFAWVNQSDYSKSYEVCLRESSPISNGVVSACAENVSSKAKSEINALYASLRRKYLASSPEDSADLEKAQKAWLSYRISHCALVGRHVGSPMIYVCPMTLNIQRVKELRELAE